MLLCSKHQARRYVIAAYGCWAVLFSLFWLCLGSNCLLSSALLSGLTCVLLRQPSRRYVSESLCLGLGLGSVIGNVLLQCVFLASLIPLNAYLRVAIIVIHIGFIVSLLPFYLASQLTWAPTDDEGEDSIVRPVITSPTLVACSPTGSPRRNVMGSPPSQVLPTQTPPLIPLTLP